MRSADDRIVALLQDARRQLELERGRRSEPIAVVGAGCRFPGGASNPVAFWRLLRDGIDASGETPLDRWDAESFYDADPDALGKAYTKRGSFLDRIDAFDPEFFGISPREAVGMDPQQRLLLEVAWEALEDARIPPERLRGSATGVWIGLCADDYARRSIQSGDATDIDAYNALGNAGSIAAGRISYILDLRGPTVQLDTACSSSLVAIHQACQSLRLGECDLALVGGVNLMSAPEMTIALCKLRALARDGRCKTFDASADGYGRGEGCGIVVLQRLRDARAAGKSIYACVRGSAVNHDGHSNGLTAPNGRAQEAVIRAALANATIGPAEVGYVEAHGTGTLLGDPIEVLALSRVYGESRKVDSPLYLGSVKTNFGHLEGAAGVAGLIKVALCLSHGELTPNLHFHNPNPKIPWSTLPVRVATQSMVWPRNARPRIAGVSSFGISGTNAHVVLEEAPLMELGASIPARAAELIVLSAKTAEALTASAARLREHLEARPELALGDVAYSLVTTRATMDHRLILSVTTRPALLEALAAVGRREKRSGHVREQAREQRPQLAWLFTGQGAQQPGMGGSLYAEWPAFREAFDEASGVLDGFLERPLREVIWAAPGGAEAALLDQTGYTQPALFAFEWALAQLWRSWGIEPNTLLGHSIGELTAACVAGVFSLSDGARLVGARARLMQSLPSGGAMVSIAAPESEVAAQVAAHARTVSIAAVNGPSSTVIAGVERDVVEIAERFRASGIWTKRLSVSHAFHSPLMDPMLEDFRKVAESIEYQLPRFRLVSNVSGELASDEIATPDYWVRHVRNPVRFFDGLRALQASGANTFIEVGPKPILLSLASMALPGDEKVFLPSLRPGHGEPQAVLEALGGWLARGGSVEWRGVFPSGGRQIQLPGYPWQRERYWIERRNVAHQAPPAESSAVANARPADTGSAGAPTGFTLPQELATLSASQRAEAIHALVVQEVSAVLSTGGSQALPVRTALAELGLDSIRALELRSALTRRIGLPFSARLVFEQLTIEDISTQLVARIPDPSRTQVGGVPHLVERQLGVPADPAPPAVTNSSASMDSSGASPSAAHCELLYSAESSRASVFCFHDAGGASSMFLPFAPLAKAGFDVHCISHSRSVPPTKASAQDYLNTAASYVRGLAARPCIFFGHSLGAGFALSVIQALLIEGTLEPVLFAPSACPPPRPAGVAMTISVESVLRLVTDLTLHRAEDLISFRRDLEADVQLWNCMPEQGYATLPTPVAAFVGGLDRLVGESDMRDWRRATASDFSLTVLPGDHFYPYSAESQPLLVDVLIERISAELGPARSDRKVRSRRCFTTYFG